MRRGMVPSRTLARYRFDVRFYRIADAERADFQHAFVTKNFRLNFLRIVDDEGAFG